jgi:hypothetical protein
MFHFLMSGVWVIYDAISINNIASNGRITYELESIWKESSCPSRSTILVFNGRDWIKPLRTSIGTADVQAEDCTDILWSNSQQRCRYGLPGYDTGAPLPREHHNVDLRRPEDLNLILTHFIHVFIIGRHFK